MEVEKRELGLEKLYEKGALAVLKVVKFEGEELNLEDKASKLAGEAST